MPSQPSSQQTLVARADRRLAYDTVTRSIKRAACARAQLTAQCAVMEPACKAAARASAIALHTEPIAFRRGSQQLDRKYRNLPAPSTDACTLARRLASSLSAVPYNNQQFISLHILYSRIRSILYSSNTYL